MRLVRAGTLALLDPDIPPLSRRVGRQGPQGLSADWRLDSRSIRMPRHDNNYVIRSLPGRHCQLHITTTHDHIGSIPSEKASIC